MKSGRALPGQGRDERVHVPVGGPALDALPRLHHRERGPHPLRAVLDRERLRRRREDVAREPRGDVDHGAGDGRPCASATVASTTPVCAGSIGVGAGGGSGGARGRRGAGRRRGGEGRGDGRPEDDGDHVGDRVLEHRERQRIEEEASQREAARPEQAAADEQRDGAVAPEDGAVEPGDVARVAPEGPDREEEDASAAAKHAQNCAWDTWSSLPPSSRSRGMPALIALAAPETSPTARQKLCTGGASGVLWARFSATKREDSDGCFDGTTDRCVACGRRGALRAGAGLRAGGADRQGRSGLRAGGEPGGAGLLPRRRRQRHPLRRPPHSRAHGGLQVRSHPARARPRVLEHHLERDHGQRRPPGSPQRPRTRRS